MAKKAEIYKMVKISTYILCLGGFIINSFETFQKYIQKTTLVLSSTQEATELPLPAFVFCNGSSYQQFTNVSIYRKEEYLKQTRDPTTYLERIYFYGSDQNLDNNLYSETALLSSLFGRCLAVQLRKKVFQFLIILAILKNMFEWT